MTINLFADRSGRQREMYCFADSLAVCSDLLDAGARIIQLRAKRLSDDAFHRLAADMQSLIRSRREPALLIINDRAEIAFEIEADGLHLGQTDTDYRTVIAEAPSRMIIGVSVHSVQQAREAEAAGAHYVGAGAVFATPTKADAVVIGPEELRRIVSATSLPVVAIGGITLANIDLVVTTGAHFFAVISAINQAPDLRASYRAFKEKIA